MKKIFTNGLLFLFVIFCFSFIYCYNYRICQIDEFVHWSPTVRSMFMNDKYYSICGIEGGIHPEYPPFLNLIELVFCIIYGSFSEGVISTSLHIISFSFIVVPYIDIFELKIDKSILLFSFLTLFIVLFDKYGAFRTIYIDIPLALICSFPILIIFSDIIDTNFGKIYFGISLSCILLIKSSGVIFYLFDIVLYFIIFIKKIRMKNIILNIASFLLITLVLYVPWLLYIYVFNSNIGLGGQFSSVGIISKLLHLQINERELDIIKRIVIYGFSENVFRSRICINYYFYYSIIILLFIIISYINKISNKKIILFVTVSIFIYFISLCFIYCFTMEDYEIYYLQNLSRYIASFNIYILIIFLTFNRSYLTNVYLNILIIVLLMIANISNYYQFIPRVLIDGRVYEEPTEGEINAANYISSYIDENSKILIITDSISAARSNYLTFYKYDIISSSIYSNAYYNNSEIPISKLIEEIKGYDYVLFNIEQDKDFNILNDSIKEYTNCDAIYNYFVYEVLKDDNKFMYLLT